jgi:ferritin-like protein
MGNIDEIRNHIVLAISELVRIKLRGIDDTTSKQILESALSEIDYALFIVDRMKGLPDEPTRNESSDT